LRDAVEVRRPAFFDAGRLRLILPAAGAIMRIRMGIRSTDDDEESA
jgi:hypothetical protein